MCPGWFFGTVGVSSAFFWHSITARHNHVTGTHRYFRHDRIPPPSRCASLGTADSPKTQRSQGSSPGYMRKHDGLPSPGHRLATSLCARHADQFHDRQSCL